MSDADDPHARLLGALSGIEVALAENVERSIEIQRRVHWFRAELEHGRSIHELVSEEARPRTVEMLTANMANLEDVGADFRANLAHALRSEGITIEAVADLYGVTRQRISALLRQRPVVESTDRR